MVSDNQFQMIHFSQLLEVHIKSNIHVKYLSLCHHIQTGSEAHPAFYTEYRERKRKCVKVTTHLHLALREEKCRA